MGWCSSNDSASLSCSWRGFGLDSQHFGPPQAWGTCLVCVYICEQHTHTHIKLNLGVKVLYPVGNSTGQLEKYAWRSWERISSHKEFIKVEIHLNGWLKLPKGHCFLKNSSNTRVIQGDWGQRRRDQKDGGKWGQSNARHGGGAGSRRHPFQERKGHRQYQLMLQGAEEVVHCPRQL